jgi:type IV secretory pathway VirJ component
MKKTLLIAALLVACLPSAAEERTVSFSSFGNVFVYSARPVPSRVALFISGDGGWNRGVVDMARQLASLDSLVIGTDINRYLKNLSQGREQCSYVAGDLEELSKFVQQKLEYPQYITPMLVGYSSGATLAYAALAQAPANTFAGAISLGFCPELTGAKPPCRGSGLEWTRDPKRTGFALRPVKNLEKPWIALQGEVDQVCASATTRAYVQQVPLGQFVLLPKVGHGFGVQSNWMAQFKQAFTNVAGAVAVQAEPSVVSVSDLPLIEVPADSAAQSDILAVHLTGDGGWGVTDRGLAQALAGHGIPVVGLNSLQYFWKRRSPEAAAADLDRLIQHYLTAWNKRRAIIIGYSFGADVLPFMLNRLPADTLRHVDLITFSDWVRKPSLSSISPTGSAWAAAPHTLCDLRWRSSRTRGCCASTARKITTPCAVN